MTYLNQIDNEGFAIINNVYTGNEIEKLISLIENVTENDSDNATFRKSQDLFAIRQFHKEVPKTLDFIFNQNLKDSIESNFGNAGQPPQLSPQTHFIVNVIYSVFCLFAKFNQNV